MGALKRGATTDDALRIIVVSVSGTERCKKIVVQAGIGLTYFAVKSLTVAGAALALHECPERYSELRTRLPIYLMLFARANDEHLLQSLGTLRAAI